MNHNVMKNRDTLLFPMAEANSILFKELPGVRTINDTVQIYRRPRYRGPGWELSKDESTEEIRQILERCREELSQHNVDLESKNWPELIKSLPQQIQFTAYSFYYWSRKSDPAIVQHLKKTGAYTSHPRIVKAHVCESCGKITKLHFGKQNKHSVKCDDTCEHCGHSGTNTCSCVVCSQPDSQARQNIRLLTEFVESWIKNYSAKIEAINGLKGDRVKEKILDAWDVHFGSEGQGSCSTSLEGLLNPKIVPHMMDDARIYEMRTRFDEVDIYKIWVPEKATAKNVISVPPQANTASLAGRINGVSRAPKVYVLSSSKKSKGFQDFISVCDGKVALQHCFFESRSEDGLYDCIAALGARRKETVVIVRGGGDITHESFNAFKSKSAAQAVSALVSLGVFVIVGVGHYDDRFLIDEKASISAITPTDAAYRLLKHVNESIINEAGPHSDKLSRE